MENDLEVRLSETHILSPEEVSEVVKILSGRKNASKLVHHLVQIARLTKSKEAVLAAVNVISKYQDEASLRLARELHSAAYRDPSGKTIVNIANIMTLEEIVNTVEKYEGERCIGKLGAPVAARLMRIAEHTLSKEATVKAAEAISKYDGCAAVDVAEELACLARNANKYAPIEETIIKIAQILSLDEVVNVIKTYDEIRWRYKIAYSFGTSIARRLRTLAIETHGNKEIVLDAVRLISSNEVLRAINNYDEVIGLEIVLELIDLFKETKDKEAVLDAAKIMASEEVSSTIKKYETWSNKRRDGMTQYFIVLALMGILKRTRDTDVIKSVVKAIGRCNKDFKARSVAIGLWHIIYYVEKEEMLTVIDTINKYDEDKAALIASGLGEIAYETKDRRALLSALNLVNKIGAQLFEVLNIKEIISAYIEGLLELIDGKDSFDAVVAYIKSKENNVQ